MHPNNDSDYTLILHLQMQTQYLHCGGNDAATSTKLYLTPQTLWNGIIRLMWQEVALEKLLLG